MSFLPTVYIQTLKERTLEYQTVRREVITQSSGALHLAKKSIFAMQRGELSHAEEYLGTAKDILSNLIKQYKRSPQLIQEGSFGAAVEEFVEATLFRQFLQHRAVQPIKGIPVTDDIFIAGLADVPGELYRYALRMGTERNIDEVRRAHLVAEEIVEALIEFDLTKHLRNKFDQAKSALQKIESVLYELTIA